MNEAVNKISGLLAQANIGFQEWTKPFKSVPGAFRNARKFGEDKSLTGAVYAAWKTLGPGGWTTQKAVTASILTGGIALSAWGLYELLSDEDIKYAEDLLESAPENIGL